MLVYFLAALLAQQPPPPPPPADARSKKPEIVILDPNAPKGLENNKEEKPKEKPAEMEEAAPPKQYAYNPYQAEKEVEVGDFYMKKHNYTAAILRYQEATKWKPNWALPYLKMGQAYEKNEEARSAAEAYRKYLEMLPKDKRAKQIREEIAKLESKAGK